MVTGIGGLIIWLLDSNIKIISPQREEIQPQHFGGGNCGWRWKAEVAVGGIKGPRLSLGRVRIAEDGGT